MKLAAGIVSLPSSSILARPRPRRSRQNCFYRVAFRRVANGQATLFVMRLDRLFAALLFGQLATLFNLVNIFIPAHVLRLYALV